MKKVLILFIALFVVATSASAATFKAGELVEHRGEPIADDLYMAGGVVDISSNVFGDSVVAGGEVSITGDVTGDALIAGGAVDLLSIVSDDVRVAGGEIRVGGTIRDDLIAAGGYVRMLGDASVGGDVVIASGASVINGTISGDVTVYGGETVIGGVINGDVNVKFTEKVTILEDTQIVGNFTYSANEAVEVPESAFIGGEITKTESPLPRINQEKREAFHNSFMFVKLMTSIVAALILVLLFKKLSIRFGEDGFENFWKNALIGFVAMVITPMLAVVLLFSVVGMFAGGILFLIGTTLLVIAKAYGGILAGAILSKVTVKKVTVDWKWAILGVAALFIVKMIPIVGGLACFLITIASFGTILMILYRGVWLKR